MVWYVLCTNITEQTLAGRSLIFRATQCAHLTFRHIQRILPAIPEMILCCSKQIEAVYDYFEKLSKFFDSLCGL